MVFGAVPPVVGQDAIAFQGVGLQLVDPPLFIHFEVPQVPVVLKGILAGFIQHRENAFRWLHFTSFFLNLGCAVDGTTGLGGTVPKGQCLGALALRVPSPRVQPRNGILVRGMNTSFS